MSVRFITMAITTVAVVFTVLGCGGDQPQFDPATQYSTTSLAKEVAFRCQSIDRSASAAEAADQIKTATGAPTKKGAETKAARTNTLGGLISETISKAGRIPNLTQAQACKKIAEEIANDSSISDSDKKAITEALQKVSD